MKTEKLLEDLENLIETSGHLIFTNKCLIEEDDLMRIVDALNESLPLEMAESRQIVEKKEEILANAQRQADTLIAQAKEYINKMTEESETVKLAQEQAAQIIFTANQSSEELKSSSLTYAADVLRYVENSLEDTLLKLRENRESLKQTRN